MKRQALIISNPGEIGEENYCNGVNQDVSNYESFLISPIGCAGHKTEIRKLFRPSVLQVRQVLKQLSGIDYSLIIFTGHGSALTPYSTILELRRKEELDSRELRNATKKQTIILDCCREPSDISIFFEKGIEKRAKAIAIHPDRCRYYYDSQIEGCGNEVVVMYACSFGQKAYDNSAQGGIYSSYLIAGARWWSDGVEIGMNRSYSILSVVDAHEEADISTFKHTGYKQKPVIEKPRSGPYFPFCVVA